MKKIILFVLIVISFSLNAQDYEKSWAKVIEFENTNKIKSANKEVEKIYKKARSNKNEAQIIKCFFYNSKYIQTLEENSQYKIITNLQREINYVSIPSKAILNFVYAKCLNSFHQSNYSKLSKRTQLDSLSIGTFLTWTNKDFENKINSLYEKTIENEFILKSTPLSHYEPIIDYLSKERLNESTVYDCLTIEYIEHLKTKYNPWLEIHHQPLLKQLFGTSNDFQGAKFDSVKNPNTRKILGLYQKLETKQVPTDIELDRLKYCNSSFYNNKLKYENSLNSLQKRAKDSVLIQNILIEKASLKRSNANKTVNANGLIEYKILLDTITNFNKKTNAYKTAAYQKKVLEEPELNVTLESLIYENQETRAHIDYKNLDSLKISIFKTDKQLNRKLNDSLITSIIKNTKAYTTQKYILENKKNYFNYSTEVLLPKLEIGYYIIIAENLNLATKNTLLNYELLNVTNIKMHSFKKDDTTIYEVFHRKTGKPLVNCEVISNDFKLLTNENGVASFKHEKDSEIRVGTTLTLIHQSDTLRVYNNYANSYYTNELNENIENRYKIYLDRAIYRPGQTVYFKVVLAQSKQRELKVLPNLVVKVIVNDSNDNAIKTIELKTNEFGSISGEFNLPKSGSTGDYSIEIDEPDNYENDSYYDVVENVHAIWDEEGLENDYFTFKVEEYKRPKFEVSFDKINKSFALNEMVSIIGKAKSFNGAIVSNAVVNYTINRIDYSRFKNKYSNEETEQIISSTKTDDKGHFTIDFKAIIDKNYTTSDKIIYQYNVVADVTDISGETQSASTSVKVGNQSTILYLKIDKKIRTDKNNLLTFSSTNLNGEFKPVNGEIKIYFLNPFSNKFMPREFSVAELPLISKEEFEKLFPYEIYNSYLDDNLQNKLVYTKKINTIKDKFLTLDFIKNYKSGKYKVVFTTKDELQNEIETIENFNLTSANDEKAGENEIVTLHQINEDPKKDGYALVEVKCAVPNLFLNAEAVFDGNYFYNEIINVNQFKTVLKIPINTLIFDSFNVRVETVFENRYFSEEMKIQFKPTVESNTIFEIESFRNKLEPGSNESWSFKIKQDKRSSEFEVLASMYDSSLDVFHIERWETINSYKNYNNHFYYKNANQHEIKTLFLQKKNEKNHLLELNNEKNTLIWFGFDFNNSKNYQIDRLYKKQVTKKSKKPKNAKLIYGIVADSGGSLPGANVVVKGTTRGVVTDVDGYYEIDAAPGEKLVYSFVGFSDEEVKIEINENEINPVLKDGPNALDEIVVTALGIKKKSGSVTSSNQVISAKELSQASNPITIQSLLGKVSGLQIVTDNNGVNPTSKIIIRGPKSNIDTEALIVIDGVISRSSDLLNLLPENISNINVMKGAQGAALYGSDSKNGVIIISTKKGLEELTKVKTRTNKNETAFFFPQLKTDKEGKINFQFTSPEELTQWKLRLLGHTKTLEYAFDEKSVVTQKDLMIVPNMPRFLRENDTISLVAKVSNLTTSAKNGMAVLQLFDASSMESIDVKMNNENAVKNFTINPSGNTVVKWNITIPSGLQGVQYKVIAKAGNHSDGEESILPVLTNSILVTESIPVWVRENTKKEYAFENLKNTTSSTLKNHQFIFEYTSNPTWLAIQSLPYLMEYEHECAEQTFSRYYANVLATKIINKNPTIANVFENWKKLGNPISKLEQNEELKSLILAETPWLKDAQSEEEKRKNLALLFDLENMKNSLDLTFKKLKEKQKSSGGFPWFDGGNESEYITRHIVAGLGHLEKLKVNEELIDSFDEITKTAIPYLDSKFIDNNKEFEKAKTINLYSDLHYLYARSFYLNNYPISDKTKAIINRQLENINSNWKQYSLYNKGLASLILHRFDKKESAKTIIESLKETASTNEDWGMYWLENKAGWYWYQAPIETQALLIEAFSEITNDTKSVDAMKVWLLKNKQTKNWSTTKATTEAIYALLMQGSNLLTVKDNTIIKIGDEKIMTKKLTESEKEAETGYIKMTWKADEVKKEMATIIVENKSKVPGYGGIYWQYFEDLDKIKSNAGAVLSTAKELYIKKNYGKGDELVRINSKNPLKIGDLVTVRIIVTAKEDMEYVHLKDMRASCFEPINVLSEYKWDDGLSYYMSTKDAATHFFFEKIDKGTYVIEYDIRVNNSGNFSNGITTIQSMYAPEFTSHTKGIRVETKE
ncbi:MG2 domain-containing protein [Flavobacterium aquatile]|uniref:alpha-2-macroglobulin family protein n=1 Tax=Flavobacterium aquatile TaxID=245 RepID=UPI00068F0B95|nr:MG2 domain-containing protein [Flavobacterium aquatile]OXA69017.1 hypothetical protein B0A61_04740 [Flavobacterium aquatile LMG 4008 = ATCC 11947]GEC77487.1 hypothetical protein FAQ01_03570 [Flavobacterium aquatile]